MQKKDLKLITFSADPIQVEMLDQLVGKLGCRTVSNAIRMAIAEFYDKKFPAYIYDRSATDKAKRKKAIEEKTFEQMDDLEYAQSIKGAVVVTNTAGRDVIAIHGRFPRTFFFFTVEGLKNGSLNGADPYWSANLPWHEEKVKQGENLKALLADAPLSDLSSYFVTPEMFASPDTKYLS